jgi:septal ring-binding cell division protein DamX
MDYSVTQYKYQEPQGEVSVPESYHVGQYQSPVSFKDRDRNWVTSQNAQGYTIELADDEKPAVVAKKLYNAPKNDRRAQIKYQRGGKSYYKGLYGTYNTPAEAQKALESLPDDVKKSAGVTSWGNVQGNLNE